MLEMYLCIVFNHLYLDKTCTWDIQVVDDEYLLSTREMQSNEYQ
jgi:hypothetical protein